MAQVDGTLVFDGHCGFCTRSAGWLRRLDRRHRVRLVPSQRPGLHRATGLTPEQTGASVWWLGRDGSRSSGANAVNAALSAALGIRLPLLLYGLTRRPQERLYAKVAANRHRLPGVTPHCEANPHDCRPG